jgi:DNA-binding transcriptional MerR regulator
MHSRVDTSHGAKRQFKSSPYRGPGKSAGVSPDTIRHYERIGVLPRASRTESGYRVYRPSAVERVLVVQRALRIEFTLAELAEVLKARDAGGAPCRRVYQLAQEKLKSIEADIEAMTRTKRYVKQVLADWDSELKVRVRGRNRTCCTRSATRQ